MEVDGVYASVDPTVVRSIPIQSRRQRALHQFTQQTLPACKPVLTPASVITTFFLLGLIFVPVGFITLRASRSVVEIVERYDADCVPEEFRGNKMSYIADSSIPKNCSRTLKVPKNMKAPIYVYYQLDNYYQNHRSICLLSTLFDLVKDFQLSDQEDFIVWMRTAALPSFRKLYGRIEVDLDMDEEITVDLMNNYNTYSFGGKKKIVLSTTSWIGGRNDFIGFAFMFVGSSSILLSLVFMLLHVKNPRTYGDAAYLAWNKKGISG
ncbi:unnamed protein product [Linum tenue]|uniref:ALA-interacting subunit n=1 Tax=Linum tenue TaxID=586396 RepID=A0AAV0QKR7_9ROSI|nr:unnamed protein product [Linum tenue]CAI0544954.1 unnamed protein product [Linum tenue]